MSKQPKFDELNREINEYKQKLNEFTSVNDDFIKLKNIFNEKVNELEEKNKFIKKLNSELSQLKCAYEEKLMETRRIEQTASKDGEQNISNNNRKDVENNESLNSFVRNELRLLQEDLNVYILNNQIRLNSLNTKYEEKERECLKLKQEIQLLEVSKQVSVELKVSEDVDNKNCNLELEMRLNNKISETVLLQEQVEYYYNMLNMYQGELDARSYQLEALNYEYKTFKESLDNSSTQIESDQHAHLIQTIEYYKAEIDSLNQNLEENLNTINRLNQELQQLKEANFSFNNETIEIKLETTTNLNETTNREVESQSNEYLNLRNESVMLIKFVLNCDTFTDNEILSKFEEVKQFKTTIESDKVEITKKLTEESQKRESIENEIVKLQNEIIYLNDQLNSKTSNADELIGKSIKNLEIINENSTNLIHSDQNNETKQHEVLVFNAHGNTDSDISEIEKLGEELKVKSETLFILNCKLNDLSMELDDLKCELSSTKDEKSESESMIKQLEEQLNQQNELIQV